MNDHEILETTVNIGGNPSLSLSLSCQAQSDVATIVRNVQAVDRSVARSVETAEAAYADALRLAAADIDLAAIEDRLHGAPTFRQGGTVAIELMPGEQFMFEGQRVEEGADGVVSWIGSEIGGEGHLVLTKHHGRLSGAANAGGRRFEITGAASGRIVIRESFPETGGDCSEDGGPDIGPRVPASAQPAAEGKAATNLTSTTVDVLVTYSDEAASYYGISNLAARVGTLVATMNQSFSSGGIDGLVRIVGFARIPSSNGDPNLERQPEPLRDALLRGDSPFGGVASLRNSFDADVVVHLFLKSKKSNLCGVATRRTATTTNEEAFAAVVAINCPTSDHTFTHEIGHVLGGNHDSNSFGSTDAQIVANLPLLAWRNSFGYTHYDALDPSASFRTLMGSNALGASSCTVALGCRRLNRWSSPTQMTSGVPAYLGEIRLNPSTQAELWRTDMVETLSGAAWDPFYGSGFPGTLRITAGARSPSYGIPGAMSNVNVSQCPQSFSITWTPGTGTIGWYGWARTNRYVYPWGKIWFPTSLSVTTQAQLTYGGSEPTYINVHACNANGCGPWTSIGPFMPVSTCQ